MRIKGDRLLQWWTNYDGHKRSGGTGYDDTISPGGPFNIPLRFVLEIIQSAI